MGKWFKSFKWPAKPPKRGIWQRYKCVGGPLNGQSLDLATPGTLTFTLGNKTGRYVANAAEPSEIHWKEVDVNE